MSNNNRGNARNANNSQQSQNQNRGPKHIWVVRPSFTLGDCRAYFTKEDLVADFGQPEESWDRVYDAFTGDDQDIWTNAKSPVWDSEFDVQWEMEKLEVRSLSQPTVPTNKPATQESSTPTTKTLVPAETEEPKSITDSDAN